MTINADFFKLVKEGCAHAFSDELPVRPDVVFIDGQVKLMKAAQIDLWSVFFQVQFFKTIENSFNLGANTVVIAFDDYKHVPASKTMTQVKRAKHLPKVLGISQRILIFSSFQLVLVADDNRGWKRRGLQMTKRDEGGEGCR